MWALQAKTCIRNRVNSAKFINLNTVFFAKYCIAHYFSLKSCLANLLEIKIRNVYEKDWLLIFEMVTQRCKGW